MPVLSLALVSAIPMMSATLLVSASLMAATALPRLVVEISGMTTGASARTVSRLTWKLSGRRGICGISVLAGLAKETVGMYAKSTVELSLTVFKEREVLNLRLPGVLCPIVSGIIW